MSIALDEIFDGWKHVFFETEEVRIEAKRRITICVDCPHVILKSLLCGRCGCPLTAKTRSLKSECPIGKWVKFKNGV